MRIGGGRIFSGNFNLIATGQRFDDGLASRRVPVRVRDAAFGFPLIILGLIFGVSVGCRSNLHTVVQARDAYAMGDFTTAGSSLRKLADGRAPLKHTSGLDLAMVEMAEGDLEAAEARLRDLRDHFDGLPESNLLGSAASLAVDDSTRLFQIAGYEQVLLRSLLAMCSLARDSGDAEAYCLQAQSRQSELNRRSGLESVSAGEDDPTIDDESNSSCGVTALHQQIALAPYLRGTLREASHQNYDDAERAFRLVSSIQPDFAPAISDIERASAGNHSASGHGVLYVFAFVGHGPRLVETVAPTTTASLQIASTILRSIHKYDDEDAEPALPNVVSVKVPTVEIPASDTAAIGVSVQGQLLGATQTITDIGRLAIEKNEAEMPHTIARAVARRVLKETTVAATIQALGLSGDAAAAFEFAAINAWSASERADVRCWALLPREIQVLRAELPVGTHQISLAPMSNTGRSAMSPTNQSITMEDGRNHYMIVIAPEQITSVIQ